MTHGNGNVCDDQKTGWGCLDSTYVRTIVCINNTYVHTDSLEANTLGFGSLGIGETNAYSITLSRGWW